MIELTKMNSEKFFLNPNLVEMVEMTPDTLISMMSGKKYYVLESVEEVSEKFRQYYVGINSPARRQKKSPKAAD